MKKFTVEAALIGTLCGLVMVCLAEIGIRALAQEVEYPFDQVTRAKIIRGQDTIGPQTKMWRLKGTSTVWVVDTAGVCLYWSNTGHLAAVPKTQLPVGTGCE